MAETEYAYLGHTLEVTDPKGRTTAYLHNAFGQIRRVVDALNGETQLSTRTTRSGSS